MLCLLLKKRNKKKEIDRYKREDRMNQVGCEMMLIMMMNYEKKKFVLLIWGSDLRKKKKNNNKLDFLANEIVDSIKK